MAFSFSKPTTDTPRIITPKLSDQQLAIIHSTSDFVVGQAFAGTGKSTTGVGYTVAHPDERTLVLCFNRANAIEANQKYPKNNVTVSTTHALAHRFLSQKQKARVTHRYSPVTLKDEIPFVGGNNNYHTAAIVHSILNEFFVSDDDSICEHHANNAAQQHYASRVAIAQGLEMAERLWQAMNTDEKTSAMITNTNAVSIPHDAYLKIFALSGRQLDFDTIIFDEAQDCNPVMRDLLLKQYAQGKKIVMLGDRHQAIYEFRGAINAMENLPETAQVLPLTESWRFGERTAHIANAILGDLKGERLKIQGRGVDKEFDKNAPCAYLARTNAALIAKGVSLIGSKIHWVGGIDGYRINILNDAWHLRCSRSDLVTDPYIRRHFKDWTNILEAAEFDHEMKILKELVEDYAESIPNITSSLRAQAVTDPEQAEHILTTAHKSKGLEWPFVRLAEDYQDVFIRAEDWLAKRTDDEVEFPEQDVNLMYVAATRALHRLQANTEMRQWFSEIEEHRKDRVRVYDPEAKHEQKKSKVKNSPVAGLAPLPIT